jgi:hypothetical protein
MFKILWHKTLIETFLPDLKYDQFIYLNLQQIHFANPPDSDFLVVAAS